MVPVTKDSVLTGTIDKYIAIRHSSKEKVASAALISKRTLHNRRKRPSSFTLEEVRRIFDYLKVPVEEREGYL